MNTRQKLLHEIRQLTDEQLSALRELAISFKREKGNSTVVQSQAYQDWLSTENDIYDEIFVDELTAR